MGNLRKNAQDYLFDQVSSVVSMSQGVKEHGERFWMKPDVFAKFKAKTEWLISEAFQHTIEILDDSTAPRKYYHLLVDGEKYRVEAEFVLIDVTGPDDDIASELHDFLTAKFYRMTQDELEGNDDVYNKFIHNHKFPWG